MAGSDIRAGKSFVELYLNKTALVKDLKLVGNELKAWGAGISSVGKKLAAMGAAITAPMLAAVHSWAASNTELAHMSERLGMTVTNLSALKYAAARSGVELSAVESAVHRTNKALGAAAKGSADMNLAFARLGLNTMQLLKMSPDERFYKIADAINRIHNPALKDAMAMQLMGRGARELGPMLADLNASRKEAEKYGLLTTPQSAAAAKELSRAWTLLEAVFGKVKGEIGGALAPMLTGLTRWIADNVKLVREWMKVHQPLIVTLFQVGATLAGVGLGLIVAGKAVSSLSILFTGTRGIIMLFGHAVGLVASMLGFLMSPIGIVIAGLAGLAAYFLYASGTADKALSWLGEGFSSLLAEAQETFGAIADALSAGDITSATKVLWAFVKLEWQKGLNILSGLWEGFKAFYQDSVSGLALVWVDMKAKIQTIWAELLNWLTKLWDKWATSTFEEGFADVIAPIMAKALGVGTEELRKTMHEDFARKRAAQPAEFAGMDVDTARRKAEIEKERQGAAGEIGADVLARQQKRAAGEAEGQRAVDAAKAELDDAQKHARKVGADHRREMEKQAKPEMTGAEGAIDTSMLMGGGSKISGTFSGAAAGMMGGSGGFQMLAKKMDKYIEHGGKLVYLTEKMSAKLTVGA